MPCNRTLLSVVGTWDDGEVDSDDDGDDDKDDYDDGDDDDDDDDDDLQGLASHQWADNLFPEEKERFRRKDLIVIITIIIENIIIIQIIIDIIIEIIVIIIVVWMIINIIVIIIIIIITRPRPAFGRLGLGGLSRGYSSNG